MFNKLYLILIILFLIPNIYSFTPIFTNSSIHYYGELVNLGIDGNLPITADYFIISISSKDTNQIYFSSEVSVFDKNSFEFSPSEGFDSNLIITYEIYNIDDNLIDKSKFNLSLIHSDFISNYVFCKDVYCSEDVNSFTSTDNIYLVNKSENIASYDLIIYNEYDHLIKEITNVVLPYDVNLDSGYYIFEIYAKYKNKIYPVRDLSLNILSEVNNSQKNAWVTYFSDLNTITQESNKDKLLISRNSSSNKNNYIFYIIISIIIISLIILIINMKRKKIVSIANSNPNRREKSHERQ